MQLASELKVLNLNNNPQIVYHEKKIENWRIQG